MEIKNIIHEGYITTFGLEFFAVDHCNLRCSGCSQCSPYLKKKFADIKKFESSLEILKKYLRPDKVTILGGEPLLHPEIDLIIAIAKSSKMFNKIQITTNGLLLPGMSNFFWSNVDILSITKYPINSAFLDSHLNKISNLCLDSGIQLLIREMNNFNRIILTEKNTDYRCVEDIFEKCKYKYYCHTLSEGRIYRCSPIVNMNKYNEVFNRSLLPDTHDFFDIDDCLGFQSKLFNYLNSDERLNGCTYCLGSSGKAFPHKQLTDYELRNPKCQRISTENYKCQDDFNTMVRVL